MFYEGASLGLSLQSINLTDSHIERQVERQRGVRGV